MSAFIRGLVHEAYAQVQIFCQLGFDPADLFIEVVNVINHAHGAGLCATVALKRDGKTCVYTMERVTPAQGRAFLDAFRAFTTDVKPTLAREQLDAIVKKSRAWRDKVSCIHLLMVKGFDVEVGRMTH